MQNTLNDNKKSVKAKLPASLIILSGFISVIIIGFLLLMLPFATKHPVAALDLLFTSTSAVCVVGLTTLNITQSFTYFGQIVILILIQIGGLGFMTAATLIFIFLGKKLTLKERLALSEAYNQDSIQGVVRLTKIIALYTLIIEFTGAAIQSFYFIGQFGVLKGVYYAVFHSVSSFCNAGISLVDFSSGAYGGNVLINMSAMSLIFLGGLGFSVIREIFTRKRSKYSFHTKVVLYVSGMLILISTLLYLIAEWNNPRTLAGYGFFDKLLRSLFQAITTRTAGFNTVSQADLTGAGKIITIINMFIGASPASTGGGIKTTTVFMLIVVLVSGLRGRQNDYDAFGRSIPLKTAIKAVTYFIYSVFIIIAFSLLLLLAESGNQAVTTDALIFETVSAFGTVGLSMGITAQLSVFSKVLIMMLMVIGRLGLLMLSIMFFSRKQNERILIKHPEATIIIG